MVADIARALDVRFDTRRVGEQSHIPGARDIDIGALLRRDRRIAGALSPQSLEFFQSMCGQLAGRYETAKEFADCGGHR